MCLKERNDFWKLKNIYELDTAIKKSQVHQQWSFKNSDWHDLFYTWGYVYTIFALIDHSPVGRIHIEEWA